MAHSLGTRLRLVFVGAFLSAAAVVVALVNLAWLTDTSPRTRQ